MSYQISDPVSLTLSTVLFPLTNLGMKAGEIRFLTNEEIVQRQGCGPGLGQLDILCPSGLNSKSCQSLAKLATVATE